MFKTGIQNIYCDFCRCVIPNSNVMKNRCFVDRFLSANCSKKRLALSGIVIVKLIISGKQFNYWQRSTKFLEYSNINKLILQPTKLLKFKILRLLKTPFVQG